MKKVKRELPNQADVKFALLQMGKNATDELILTWLKHYFVAADKHLAKGWAKKVRQFCRIQRRQEFEAKPAVNYYI